ncbi:MAG: YeeE/YedE thiosulfate transporter family protein [Planctomycetota bacterium]
MFDTSLFAPMGTLLLGALTGLVFGFLLMRGNVARNETIVGQFLLRDHTVLKVMLTAIVVGGVGIHLMSGLGWIALSVKGAHVIGQLVGGVIFGAGMAILGYCPGTAFVALGAGSRGAIPGILGMLFGTAVYAETDVWMQETVLKPLALGKVTLDSVTGLSPWLFLAALAAGGGALFVALERHARRGATA